MMLLKHEWLRTRTLVGTVAGMAVLLTLLGTGLTATAWPVLSPLGMLLGGIAITVLVPGLQLALTADYYRSSYSRTGYFTHSLPIRGGRIYAAKAIWAVLVTLAGLGLTLVLFGVFWVGVGPAVGMDRNPFTAAGMLWDRLSAVSTSGMLAGGVLLLLAMYLIWPIHYFFAVSRGSERPLNRWGLGGPVLVFVVLYTVTQLAGIIGMIVIPFGIGLQNGALGVVSYRIIAEMQLGSASTEDVMPLGFIPAILLVTVFCAWRTVRSWNHKISLA